jgi:hypothetical protein
MLAEDMKCDHCIGCKVCIPRFSAPTVCCWRCCGEERERLQSSRADRSPPARLAVDDDDNGPTENDSARAEEGNGSAIRGDVDGNIWGASTIAVSATLDFISPC